MRRRCRKALAATWLLGFAVLTCRAAPLRAQAVRDSAAHALERAAREWLFLLDEARYDSAWTQVAPAMKSAVTYQRWATSLEKLRTESLLPRPLRRALIRAEPTVPLFGGRAVILSFDLGPVAPGSPTRLRELVVLSYISGRWLVAGYGLLPERTPAGTTPAR